MCLELSRISPRLLPLLLLWRLLLLAACGPQVASIDVEPAHASLTAVGQTRALHAVAKNGKGEPQTGIKLTWASSDAKVAAVDGQGVVTAISTGDALITASHEARVRGAANVTVSLPHALLVSPDRVLLHGIGERARVRARVVDAKGREVPGAEVSWDVENPDIVAAIDGELTAVGIGTGRAVAVFGTIRAPVLVQVKEPAATAIEVTPSPAEAHVRRELKLAATATDADGDPLPGAKFHYVVEDPSVATVDETGVVTPLAPGRTNVRIRSGGAETMVELVVRK